MHKKIFTIFFIAIFFTGSCSSIPAAPASQPVAPSTNTPFVPTLFPTSMPPTETAAPQVTDLILIEPTYAIEPSSIITSTIPADSQIPLFPGAQNVAYNFAETMIGQPGNTVYYTVPETPGEVQAFYMEELTRDGWEWVYTESGESLATTVPSPASLMEFKRGEQKLGIAAHEFWGEGSIVLAGVNISGAKLITSYIGGIAGGLDLMGPVESDVKPDVMQFSSTLMEFNHPSNWLATDELMQIFYTDNAINYFEHKNDCSVEMDTCFANFAVLTGSHFDKPISIRAHPEMANLTLEEASARRWDELIEIASTQNSRYNFPEDLAQAESIQTIEVRNMQLSDGTPAIQRIYRWKQKDVKEFIIGAYTLFVNEDLLMELHTDFTSEEWKKERPTVDQVIASMKITQ